MASETEKKDDPIIEDEDEAKDSDEESDHEDEKENYTMAEVMCSEIG